MLAFVYVSAFVVAAWLPFVWFHHAHHGVVNPAHVTLTLFNAVNLLICVWEHALFLYRAEILREHKKLKVKHCAKGKRALPSPLCLFENITLRQALSHKHWSVIWSQYSLLDPSYADPKSFGFWIDTGNGIVTLPATLLLSYHPTFYDADVSLWQPRTVGVIGMIFNYQMLYGTVLYFASYRLNRYHEGASRATVMIVIAANAVWFVFPGWWMAVCWEIVQTNTWDALR